MNMEMYWSQQDVFLMGTLSLFPEKLLNIPITLDEKWYFFDSKTDEELVRKLYSYKKAGYIEFKEIPLLVVYADRDPDPDDESNFRSSPLGFMITFINNQKVTDDLTQYLENWYADKLSTNSAHKPDDHTHQYRRLTSALIKSFARQSMPHINAVDLYGDNKTNFYNYPPPFWETVLAPHLVTGQYSIRQMDYDLVNRGQPFVSIELTNQKLRRWLELEVNSSEPISDDDPEELNYGDLLAARDGTISYKGVMIPFTRQEVDVMRVFLRRPGELRTEDNFTDPYANVFDDPSAYRDIHTTLSKLIARTRKKLNEATHKSNDSYITNVSGRGWILKIPSST
jgi:DNA-binding winged helix-turn-helix (wHTH) protein